MDFRTYLRRLLTYNDWANRETLRSLRASPNPPAISVKRMAHLVGAEETWSQRLQGGPVKAAVWPELTLDECAARLDALKNTWQGLLETLDPDPQHAIEYTNSKGETYTNLVNDVMAHVIIHQAYHRGQIASDLRANGDTPDVTDFIFYLRDRSI